MRVIYISNLCSKNTFEYIKKNSYACPSLCEQKYHSVMVKGLYGVSETKMEAVTAVPVSRATSGKILWRIKKESDRYAEYNYLPVINLPIIKHIVQMLLSFVICSVKCIGRSDVKFLCDMLCGSTATGALLAAKIFRKEFTGIVTDIPKFFSEDERMALSDRILTWQISACNSYIILTDAMNDLINKNRRKAYRVIEGQADYEQKETVLQDKHEVRVCMYAGAVEKLYGLDKLVDAFVRLDYDNTVLHIYGTGSYVKELLEVCHSHSNIKYMGVKANDEIVLEETRATLLVNPRPSDKAYTKYSFPSKTMEYLASGTPVLTTKLPGIPKEYFEHLFVIEDESTYGIEQALRVVLDKTDEELFHFGKRGQAWVINNKNCKSQAKKIFDMWNAKF